MKVAFIINDFNSMNLEKDTSIFLMNEAYNRGYEVFSFGVNEVTYKSNNLYAECEKVNFPDPSLLSFTKENADLQNLKDFDYVINRVTPPFNKEYLYLTQLLDLAKIKCINPTQALREENEKLVILNFPELIPVTKVTNSLDEIKNMFDEGYKKIVIKPLDGMGGKSIFTLNESDKNINVIWETVTQNGRKQNNKIKLGICGEHGGDPKSIYFCSKTGLDYVSCSPYRVPVARLAAAQAELKK